MLSRLFCRRQVLFQTNLRSKSCLSCQIDATLLQKVAIRHSGKIISGPFRSRLLSTLKNEAKAVSRSARELTTNSTKNEIGESPTWWYNIAKTLKVVRLPFLIGSIYYLGYNQGVMNYSRNPDAMRKQIMQQILNGFGGPDVQFYSIREGDTMNNFAKLLVDTNALSGYGEGANRRIQLRNVAVVGSNIIRSAKNLVEEEMQKVAQEHKQRLKDEPNFVANLENNSQYIYWKKAKERLGVESGVKWAFVLVDIDEPNAFVSEFVPSTIFVTQGMLEMFIANNDELALILGHEISHLICGHISNQYSREVYLKMLEIMFLAIDPTNGFMGVTIVAAANFIREVMMSSHSRHNEREADEMGIKIAAMACYDTKAAPIVMHKMHEAEKGALDDTDVINLSLFRSHPPSNERFLNLKDMGNHENPTKYFQSHCAEVKQKFKLSWKKIPDPL